MTLCHWGIAFFVLLVGFIVFMIRETAKGVDRYDMKDDDQ